jgi:hypothetical protein
MSKIYIGPESTCNPPRRSETAHQWFQVLLDAPRVSWSRIKCPHTLEQQYQVLLKVPAAMEVHSGCVEV